MCIRDSVCTESFQKWFHIQNDCIGKDGFVPDRACCRHTPLSAKAEWMAVWLDDKENYCFEPENMRIHISSQQGKWECNR